MLAISKEGTWRGRNITLISNVQMRSRIPPLIRRIPPLNRVEKHQRVILRHFSGSYVPSGRMVGDPPPASRDDTIGGPQAVTEVVVHT